jgi:hypothetical protein
MSLSLFALFVAVNVTLKNTYDFSFLRSFINLIGSIILCVCFVYKVCTLDKYNTIYEYFFIILLAQSFIVIAMMFIPSIKDFIQGFSQSAEAIERMSTYMGVRGLGLTGSIAFGFAITMAILLFSCLRGVDLVKNEGLIKVNSIVFLIIAFACLSAGRTSVIGIVLGLIYLLLINIKNIYSIIRVFSVITILIIVIWYSFTFLLDKQSSIYSVFEYYSKYVFQSVYNYVNTGSFSVSSVDSLIDKMYFLPDGDLVFGHGKYTTDTDRYYMETDAGYMRFLLYFGTFGSALIYTLFTLIFVYVFIKAGGGLNLFYYLLFLFFMSIILHYKGEVILYNVAYMKVLFMSLLFELTKSSR